MMMSRQFGSWTMKQASGMFLSNSFGVGRKRNQINFLLHDCNRYFASKSNHVVPTPKNPYDDPLSPIEELEEKERVAKLTAFQKEAELRELDKQITLLNTYRDINTGDKFTFKGKMKAYARDYGMGFMAWFWTVYVGSLALTYTAIEVGGFEALPLIAKVDGYFGTNMAGSLDPRLGNVALALAVNELLEPFRLPFVVVTAKPVVKMFRRR